MRNLEIAFRLKAGASLVAISAVLAGADVAFAAGLPSHGHMVAGQGSINKANQSLTVRQSSTMGVIDWKSFSIGSKNSVMFRNGSGATLNRVSGGDLSTIAGSLHATGSLYLINSAGVIVSGTGRVITGGNFVVTSGTISGDAFGDDERIRGARAAVVNRGVIRSGGSVILNGGKVENEGAVTGANVRLRAIAGDLIGGGTIRATGGGSTGGDILLISETGETKIRGDLVARGRGAAIETSGQKLSIDGTVDAGNGGKWLVDPENLTVTSSAAKTIDKSLDTGTSVTLQTTASGTSGPGTASNGAGDIVIDAALSWDTSATLTLDAYHSITIDKTMSVKGAGNVVLKTDDGGTGGDYGFGSGASLDFGSTNNGAALTINGTSFSLLYSLAAVQGINTVSKLKNTHNYALATSLNAKSTTGWVPIGTDGKGDVKGSNGFAGVFEGLGNSISNLVVNLHGNDYAGLFGYSDGTIRDVALKGGSTTGDAAVGGLVGEAFGGVLLNDSNTGSVTGSQIAGGLVGYSDATVSNSFATGTVTADANLGGLVGQNYGSVSTSYATGAVTGSKSGGNDTGGLVGTNAGTVAQSYATGAVTGSGTVGGLVGGNYALGTAGMISNSYALGSVSAAASSKSDVGGLVGLNDGSISAAYAVGAVASGTHSGGLIGAQSGGTVSSAYWDTQTSGQSLSAGGTGLTTSKLEKGLPTGFGSDWAIVPGKSFPYLTWQFASGKPQVVSGTIAGEANAAGHEVGLRVNGKAVTEIVSMGSGANGYYYELLAPGTISSAGADVLAYLTAGSLGNSVFADATGSLSGLALTVNTLAVKTSAKKESSLLQVLETALGSNSSRALYTSSGAFKSGIDLTLNLSASSFTIDHAIDISSGTLDLDVGGTITQDNADSIDAGEIKGTSHGAVKLKSSKNAVADLGTFSTNAGSFAFTDNHALTVLGHVTAGTLALTTTGSGNGLNMDSTITGGTINLVTAGEAKESNAGAIVASAVLNVTANTGIDLASKKNKIKKLGTDKTKSGPNQVSL